MLVTSMATVKNYVLLGDVHHSLTFVQAAPGMHQLAELSRVQPTASQDR